MKTAAQEKYYAASIDTEKNITLEMIASEIYSNLGDHILQRREEKKNDFYHFRMLFDEQMIRVIAPADENNGIRLYREEMVELGFAYREQFQEHLTTRLMITKHCSYLDLILFKRFFLFQMFFQRSHYAHIESKLDTDMDEFYGLLRSIVPIMSRKEILQITSIFLGDEKKAIELLDLLSWSGPADKKLDLQYTPFLKFGADQYFVSYDILASSNIIRNSVARSRITGCAITNSDGTDDPLVNYCQNIFNNCTYPYHTASQRKYNYHGNEGEIDFIAWSTDRIYIFECKNAIFPAGSHELRTTLEYIQSASKQLSQSKAALSDPVFRKQYFKSWGIEPNNLRSIHTCILLGNRLFTGTNSLQHQIRYIRELDMILTTGVVYGNGVERSCWCGKHFSDDDLAKYLSDDDLLSKVMMESMFPNLFKFQSMEKTFRRQSFGLNQEQYYSNAKMYFLNKN